MPPEIKKSTLLHAAVCEGDYAKVRSLLQSGNNANAQNEEGDTPLHLAVRYGRYNAVPILIGSRANAWSENNKGHTPLCEAIMQRNPQIFVDMVIFTHYRLRQWVLHNPDAYQGYIDEMSVYIDKYLQIQQKRKLEEVDVENIASKKNKAILETPLYMKN